MNFPPLYRKLCIGARQTSPRSVNMFTPFFRNVYLVRVYRSRLGWDIKWRPILAEFEVLHIQRHYISLRFANVGHIAD